jgi:cytochrome c-type biogenesis protein CcmH/NrfG
MGRMLVVLKRYQEAEAPLKTAVEVSPQSFQTYNLLGRTYLALERYDDAEKTYTTAVDLVSAGDRKQLAGAYGFEGVGDGFMKAKRRSDATRVYQRALDLDPDNQQLKSKLSKARG